MGCDGTSKEVPSETARAVVPPSDIDRGRFGPTKCSVAAGGRSHHTQRETVYVCTVLEVHYIQRAWCGGKAGRPKLEEMQATGVARGSIVGQFTWQFIGNSID